MRYIYYFERKYQRFLRNPQKTTSISDSTRLIKTIMSVLGVKGGAIPFAGNNGSANFLPLRHKYIGVVMPEDWEIGNSPKNIVIKDSNPEYSQKREMLHFYLYQVTYMEDTFINPKSRPYNANDIEVNFLQITKFIKPKPVKVLFNYTDETLAPPPELSTLLLGGQGIEKILTGNTLIVDNNL